MQTIRHIIVASVAVLVASCSGQPPSLVGKWLTPTGGSIEFKTDGTAIMAGPTGSQQMPYRLLDQRTIEIRRRGGTRVLRWQILSVGPQELVIQDADGKPVNLRHS